MAQQYLRLAVRPQPQRKHQLIRCVCACVRVCKCVDWRQSGNYLSSSLNETLRVQDFMFLLLVHANISLPSFLPYFISSSLSLPSSSIFHLPSCLPSSLVLPSFLHSSLPSFLPPTSFFYSSSSFLHFFLRFFLPSLLLSCFLLSILPSFLPSSWLAATKVLPSCRCMLL